MPRDQEPITFTFGSDEDANITLTGLTEVYTNQVPFADYSQIDLRPVYVPVDVSQADVKLAVRVYISDDPFTTAAASSTWHPVSSHDNDGSGNMDAVVDVYRNPALTADIAKRNTNIQLFAGAKKIRIGLQEEGGPSGAGAVSSFGGTFRK